MCLYNPKLKIKNLCNIDVCYLQQLNDDVLKHLMFKYVEKLDANDNSMIKNINFLIRLQVLFDAGQFCGIDDEGMKECKKITELYTNNNDKITNINHLVDLQELVANRRCGIDDEGMIKCKKIKKLDVTNNNKTCCEESPYG